MAQSTAKTSILRIGSRGSPLALVQAREVQSRLAAACGLDPAAIEIKSFAPTAMRSRTGHSPRPAVRGCSPRKSKRRCFRRHRPRRAFFKRHDDGAPWPGWRFQPTCRAKTRAMLSSAIKLNRWVTYRPALSSARRRCGARPWSSGCGQTLVCSAARQCRNPAAQDRGRCCRCDAACGRRAETARPAFGRNRVARYR